MCDARYIGAEKDRQVLTDRPIDAPAECHVGPTVNRAQHMRLEGLGTRTAASTQGGPNPGIRRVGGVLSYRRLWGAWKRGCRQSQAEHTSRWTTTFRLSCPMRSRGGQLESAVRWRWEHSSPSLRGRRSTLSEKEEFSFGGAGGMARGSALGCASNGLPTPGLCASCPTRGVTEKEGRGRVLSAPQPSSCCTTARRRLASTP